MTTIAVIGPGAIGGTIAGWLSQSSEHTITVCARTPFERLEVEVPGGKTLVSQPAVLVDPAHATRVDWVLAVTKTYDTASVSPWLERLVGPTTCVAVIQNGVEHLDRFSDRVSRDRTLPVIVDIPADKIAPGRARQRRHGDITVPESDLGREFVALFSGLELSPRLSPDFLSVAWRKLVLNSAAVVTALTQRPAGVARNEGVARLMRRIAAETIAVGRAEGAVLDETLADEVVRRYQASPPDTVNSLLADRLAGRPVEVDARNGVVVRLGAIHGIDTPCNEMAVALLDASISR